MKAPLPGLKPLSARSVVLSLLLGSRPAHLPVGRLIELGEMFDIAPATLRVALSRMVGAGDLEVEEATYALAPRHHDRQAGSEAALHPRRRAHNGMWRTLVVVDRGRPVAQRNALRSDMATARYAELREGVWTRPDNLVAPAPPEPLPEELLGFTSIPDDEQGLAHDLWDLDGWASEACALHALMVDTGLRPVERLTAAAAAVRLLRTDPVLPDELAPEHWPADKLRWAYEDYRTTLMEMP